tara:strand:+ start:126 stop:449 length:324 start_codon:yes stop_codon:yes gene_type:complete
MNKKGLIDDWFDFMVTVVLAFFALFFLYGVLVASVNGQNDKSVYAVTDLEDVHNAVVTKWDALLDNSFIAKEYVGDPWQASDPIPPAADSSLPTSPPVMRGARGSAR